MFGEVAVSGGISPYSGILHNSTACKEVRKQSLDGNKNYKDINSNPASCLIVPAFYEVFWMMDCLLEDAAIIESIFNNQCICGSKLPAELQ